MYYLRCVSFKSVQGGSVKISVVLIPQEVQQKGKGEYRGVPETAKPHKFSHETANHTNFKAKTANRNFCYPKQHL